MEIYGNKYLKYKIRYQNLKAGASDDITNVFALVDHELSNCPVGWENITDDIPSNQYLLNIVVNTNEKYRVYNIPILPSVNNLRHKYGKLENSLHMNQDFERDITEIEREYLQIVRGYNPNIQWDMKWAKLIGVTDREFCGVIGSPINTIIIGFTNNP